MSKKKIDFHQRFLTIVFPLANFYSLLQENRGHHRKNGFTLIELTMVIVLVGIMAGIAAPLTVQLIDSFVFSLDQKDISGAAEMALKRMEREIRRLKNDTSVLTAGSNTYRFVDIDGKTIQFALNGTNLERFDGTNIDVVATRVTSLSFEYLDNNLATIVTPTVNPQVTNVKFVQINVGFTAGSNTISYMTLIQLRNMVQQSDLFL